MSNVIGLATKSTKAPMLENRKVPVARRPKNADVRSREYLTADEVAALIKAAKKIGRHCARDATLIRLIERHGFRVSEVINLRWDAVDLKQGQLAVSRLKNGTPSTHYLKGDELRELRALRRETEGAFVFSSERGAPMTADNVRKLVARAGKKAGLGFPVHPHMLRHATGFRLASKGHDTRAIQGYLGHRNITHTVRYTELAPDRFKDF